MSVSTLPSLAMKEKSNSIPDILIVNNNVNDLKISDEESVMHDCRNSVHSQNDEAKIQSEFPPGELTDDTVSDSPSGEVPASECSGKMYDSEEIIFDEELSTVARSNSVDYLKERAVEMLQEELNNARKELEIKDEKCKELSTVRSKVEAELEELTASLFEEAHKMVHDANMKQFIAEKKTNEAKGEIEALQTEISALKALVLTSTPSNPNPQLHPQLIKKKKDILIGSPLRKHRRNRSDVGAKVQLSPSSGQKAIIKMGKEVDTVIMHKLSSWLKTTKATPPTTVNHSITDQSENVASSVTNNNALVDDDYDDRTERGTVTPVKPLFLEGIEAEDVKPCLTFTNMTLSEKVFETVHNNTLTMEPLSKPVWQQCALTRVTVCCKHRIKCGDSETWFPISRSCRTRIASVCDYLTYIRYIEQGLVKHLVEQIYWEINRLRREMALAKLGYYKEE